MNITLLKSLDSGVFVDRNAEFDSKLFQDQEVNWIDVKISKREELKEFSQKAGFSDELYERLQLPGKTYRIQRYGQYYLLDIHLFEPMEVTSTTYFTFIFHGHTVFSFSDIGIYNFQHFMSILRRLGNQKHESKDLLAFFFNHMIDDDLQFARKLRGKLERFSKKVFTGFDDHDPTMIRQYKTQIEKFLAIIEDQYLSMGLIPDFSGIKSGSETRERFSRIASHLEHIQSMMERAEDKLDFLFQQYQGDMQELNNKRINTLTIVQAIFVPLTFIAGIYGMNFARMPELEWSNGYFYALGLMGMIAIMELFIFWRSGWFN